MHQTQCVQKLANCCALPDTTGANVIVVRRNRYLGRFKGDATLLLQAQNILHQEAVGVVPGQEHILDNSKHALLLEAQGLSSHHWGVDQVQAQGIGTILVQDQCWVLQ